MLRLIFKGGPGSGFHGHAGRPGSVGGSSPDNIWEPDPNSYIIGDDHWNEDVRNKTSLEATRNWAKRLHSRGWTKDDIQEIVDHTRGSYPQLTDRNYSPDWGMYAGDHIAYRVGNVSANESGIWFGPDSDELEMYRGLHDNRGIERYTVTVNNPAVFNDKNDIVRQFFPKKDTSKYPYNVWIRKLIDGNKFGHDAVAANRWLDAQLVNAVRKKGYDAIVLKFPELPATREIAVFDPIQVSND